MRGRERLVHQRTADVIALRALLYERGYVFPVGMSHLNRMTALVQDETVDLHALIQEECLDLLGQIAEKTARIIERTTKLKTLATQSDRARRLQTMLGGWTTDGRCSRSVWFRHGGIQNRAQLCGLVGLCSSAAFLRRQGAPWSHNEGWSSRYPTPVDHRRNVETELARTAHNYGGQLAVTHAGAQTQDAGRDRARQ